MCSEINKEATRLERQRATTQLDYRVVVIELLLERDGRDCRRCGASLGVDLQCNHIHRREHGGLNTLSNLELLCEECHRFEARIEYRSRPIPLQSLDEQLERLLTGGRR